MKLFLWETEYGVNSLVTTDKKDYIPDHWILVDEIEVDDEKIEAAKKARDAEKILTAKAELEKIEKRKAELTKELESHE